MIKPDQLTDLEQGLMRYFAHTPELVKGLAAFSGGLKMNRTLPEKLVELVRLRVAFFNQCRSCMAIRYTDALNDGLTEDLVCSLERPEEADDLTDAEKAAVKFGELMATDHLRIDDAMYEELKKHFTQPQIVELGMIVAFFVGWRLPFIWSTSCRMRFVKKWVRCHPGGMRRWWCGESRGRRALDLVRS